MAAQPLAPPEPPVAVPTPAPRGLTPLEWQRFASFFALIEEGCDFDPALSIANPELAADDPIVGALRYEVEKPVEYVPLKPSGRDYSNTRMPEPKPLTAEDHQRLDMTEAYEQDRDGSNPAALAAVKAETRRYMAGQRVQAGLGRSSSGFVAAVAGLVASRSRERRPRRAGARARSPGGRDGDPEPPPPLAAPEALRANGASRPALVIVLPYEGHGRVIFDAASHEDELRLRAWLRSSDVFAALPDLLARLLDDLDGWDADEGEAA